MTPQVLAVQARLMQDDVVVQGISTTLRVNRLTAATVYCATGRQPHRTIKVLAQAAMDLRGHSRDGKFERRYNDRLIAICLELAKRTTAPSRRKRKANKRQP